MTLSDATETTAIKMVRKRNKDCLWEASTGSTSSIQDFPLLVLTKIFKLLSTGDRESAMKVCSRWYYIIKFEVGLNMFIGNGLMYNLPDHKTVKWQPAHFLSKMGTAKCIFGEMVDETSCEKDDSAKDDHGHGFEGFLLPELVRELSFYGKITNELFRVLLTPVYWLTTLKLHLIVFRLVSFEKYTLKLYSLTHLRIFYTHPVYRLSFPFKEDELLAKRSLHMNVSRFLNTCWFRNINVFEFIGPYFFDETISLLDTIRSFVRKHHISLKELILSFPYEWNVENMEKRQEVETSFNIAKSSEDERLRLQMKQCRHFDWGNVQLRRLQVVCPATIVPPISAASIVMEPVSAWSKRFLHQLWESALEKQTNLVNLKYINKYANWVFPETIILNNARFLKVISLNVSSKFDVDCQVLSCCENLIKLCLEGNFFHSEENDNINIRGNDFENSFDQENHKHLGKRENGNKIQRVFNVHQLPDSLQEICLSKLMVPISEVEAFFDPSTESLRFPNLKSLQLYQICKALPDFGLTTFAVKRLFDQSNLSVSFWQALNCTSFETAINKLLNNIIDPEAMTLMKVLQHCDIEEYQTLDESLQFATVYDCHVQLIQKLISRQ